MRDEMDARLWNEHHETFSEQASAALDKVAGRARRASQMVPMPLKVMAAVLAASLIALTSPAPAFAQSRNLAPAASVEVPYGDLNIRSPAGRRMLTARVRGAATLLCRPHLNASIREQIRRRACFEAALSDANAQIAQALAARGRTETTIAIAER